MTSEVRRHGATIDNDAARTLVDAVGQDLRSLSAAAHQLTNDFPGEKLTADKVARYFGGRAEAKSFVVADHAFSGRREQALEELRWALDNGTAAVLITSAFAGSARGLARYKGASRGMREATWPSAGRRARRGSSRRSGARRSRGPTSGLARAIRAVAQADADVKGAASDAAYALERLVLTVAGAARLTQAQEHQTTAPTTEGDGSCWKRALRARRPSWRSPTCGWRPGSCG